MFIDEDNDFNAEIAAAWIERIWQDRHSRYDSFARPYVADSYELPYVFLHYWKKIQRVVHLFQVGNLDGEQYGIVHEPIPRQTIDDPSLLCATATNNPQACGQVRS